MILINILQSPWPWYVAGPIIGLMVPLLLILGNKSFGISSNLRHICAACFPANIPFFRYDWKKEIWNLVLVAGVVIGAWITVSFFNNPDPIALNPALVQDLEDAGISSFHSLAPTEIFSWAQLFTAKSLIMIVAGGFMVGFGTRYAGGCTSGHAIMGLSSLQWPSLVATICFMIGGFTVANLVIPYLLKI